MAPGVHATTSIAYGLGSALGSEDIAIDPGLLNQFLSPRDSHTNHALSWTTHLGSPHSSPVSAVLSQSTLHSCSK